MEIDDAVWARIVAALPRVKALREDRDKVKAENSKLKKEKTDGTK